MSTLFSGHYLHNRSTLDIGVLGYIGIVQHKEHSPEVSSIPPGTPCICKVTEWWSMGAVERNRRPCSGWSNRNGKTSVSTTASVKWKVRNGLSKD